MCTAAAGWLARLLRGGRSIPPQIVLLDHGTYIHLDEQLRQQYCQLWCSFVMNDAETARQVGFQKMQSGMLQGGCTLWCVLVVVEI